MKQQSGESAAADGTFQVVDSSLMVKVFYAFVALTVLSVAISVGGKWLGRSIAKAGNTDDVTLREIVIGNNVLSVPANAIRFEHARRNGSAARVDLYLRWPNLDGYSEAARADFSHAGGSRRIIFAAFEPRAMSRDMSGRFAPIYSSMVTSPGTLGPAGLTFYRFTEQSGYVNEMLAVAEQPGALPFVARCLTGPGAADSLAPCERDVQLGDNLSLTYRFPAEFLGEWQAIESAMRNKAAELLKTGL